MANVTICCCVTGSEFEALCTAMNDECGKGDPQGLQNCDVSFGVLADDWEVAAMSNHFTETLEENDSEDDTLRCLTSCSSLEHLIFRTGFGSVLHDGDNNACG